jgi:hypothetical protein
VTDCVSGIETAFPRFRGIAWSNGETAGGKERIVSAFVEISQPAFEQFNEIRVFHRALRAAIADANMIARRGIRQPAHHMKLDRIVIYVAHSIFLTLGPECFSPATGRSQSKVFNSTARAVRRSCAHFF